MQSQNSALTYTRNKNICALQLGLLRLNTSFVSITIEINKYFSLQY